MHQFQCKTVGVLGAVLFVAVGFAALREADALWDICLFSLTLGLLLMAVLLAIYRTEERRASWVGFALFGWGYLTLSLIPWTEPRLITTNSLPYLYQSRLFGIRAYEMRIILSPDRMRAYNLSTDDIKIGLTPSTIAGSPTHFATKTWQSKENELGHTGLFSRPERMENIVLKATPDGEIVRLKDVAKAELVSAVYIPRGGAGIDENFVRIGHSLFALLAAWLGGVLARRLRSAVETTSNG